MRKILEMIMSSNQMTDEEKLDHYLTIINIAYGENHFITEGLYLKIAEKDNDLTLQLWSNNEDTGYSDEQILNLMHREFLNRERGIRR